MFCAVTNARWFAAAVEMRADYNLPDHGREIDESAIGTGVDDEMHPELRVVIVVEQHKGHASNRIGADAEIGIDRPHRIMSKVVLNGGEDERTFLSDDCGTKAIDALREEFREFIVKRLRISDRSHAVDFGTPSGARRSSSMATISSCEYERPAAKSALDCASSERSRSESARGNPLVLVEEDWNSAAAAASVCSSADGKAFSMMAMASLRVMGKL